jgi:NAD(P)-dependent dehydrogenase (short-subunit alcohol dehydrogenase family)
LPTPHTVYLTSRSGIDLPSPPSTSQNTYIPRKLDISDPAAIKALAQEVKKDQPGGIDAVINNAGVNLNPGGYSKETIMGTMKINYHGTKAVGGQLLYKGEG